MSKDRSPGAGTNSARFRPLLFAFTALLALVVAPAQAGNALNLDYVDKASPQYARFKGFVDAAVAGNPGYAFSATDAVYAYRITGDAQYAQLAIAMVEQQVQEAEAIIATGERPPISGDSYLDVGPMLRDLSLVYDWCGPLLTTNQKTRWAAYAEQAVWNVWHHEQAQWGGVAHPWSGWSVDNPGNNYYYSFLEATMYWAFASDSTAWRQFLATEKLPPLVAYFSTLDGVGSREGTAYGLSQGRLFELYRVWRDNTGVDLAAQNDHLDASIDWWLHATVPTMDFVAALGDQARVSEPAIYDYHRNLVLQARMMSGDTAARQRASWWLQRISIPEMSSGFNFRHDLLPAGSSDQPPTALYYHALGTGHLFARTSWTTDAMWLSFVAGPYVESHAHQDQGGFTLYKRDWLAVTENIWTHSGIQQGTEVHNVLRFVDGDGNTIRQVEGTTSSTTVSESNGGLDVAANLTPAYNENPQVASWQRALRFAGGVLRVQDSYTVASDVQAIFQVNLPLQPVITGNTARAGDLYVRVISPANATLSAMEWNPLEPTEFYEGWKLEVRGNTGQYIVELSDATAAVPPVLSIADATVVEGDGGARAATFTVSLTAPAPPEGVSFDIETASIRSIGASATSGDDYMPVNLVGHRIAAGQTSATVNVKIMGDRRVERDEVFGVRIRNVTGATSKRTSAYGTIVNDDGVAVSTTRHTVPQMFFDDANDAQ